LKSKSLNATVKKNVNVLQQMTGDLVRMLSSDEKKSFSYSSSIITPDKANQGDK